MNSRQKAIEKIVPFMFVFGCSRDLRYRVNSMDIRVLIK
jgi:hypothetical protein